jgi:hypothetical protein
VSCTELNHELISIYFLLAVGNWQLATGGWLLAAGRFEERNWNGFHIKKGVVLR